MEGIVTGADGGRGGAVVRMWLVRHGETEWNAQRRFQGWSDIPLNEKGRMQAGELAGVLSAALVDRSPTVWSSDLVRAVETARIAFGEPRIDPRLRELEFGEMEGRTWTDLDDETRARLASFDEFGAPGGETMAAMRSRVLGFVAELEPGDHLLFTHGAVIRLLMRECASEGFPQHGDVICLDWTARARLDAAR